MQVVFNTKIPIIGIGMVPWTRLGPERWFDDYAIGSFHDWDVRLADAPRVFSLTDINPGISLSKINTQHLLENQEFQCLLLRNAPRNAHVLTYKPVSIPGPLQSLHFLSSDQKLVKQLENKQQFRELMKDSGVPFPRYNVYERATLHADMLGALLGGREEVVLQDENLSGGKGTFMVRDKSSLQYALDSLNRMTAGRFVVISERIKRARERSVQAVITRHGVFVGPLQKQIIADPLLSNLDVPDGDRFCGAEISATDTFAGAYDEIRRYALQIGRQIQGMGYKGIFSLDCLVSESGRVYVLEINPRITGITPLLTMLHREGEDIPFYLLHILELLGAEYDITDMATNPAPAEGSLLILHSQSSQSVRIQQSPSSGLYKTNPIAYATGAFRLESATPDDQVLVQQYVPANMTIKPGGRLMTLFFKQSVLTDTEVLTRGKSALVTDFLNRIELKSDSQ